MPPLPKPAGTAARRNKRPGIRLLTTDPHDIAIPDLPAHGEDGWLDQTVAWWASVWRSPMAVEFDDSDRHGLVMLAVLVDDFWRGDHGVIAEIRLQCQRFGLSPLDRRRLQWEIDRGEAAASKTEARRSTPKSPRPKGDPRRLLAL